MIGLRKNKYRYTRSMVYDYSRVARVQARRNKGTNMRRFFLLSVYFFLLAFILHFFSDSVLQKSSTSNIISPLVESAHSSVIEESIQNIRSVFASDLKRIVEENLGGEDVSGRYSVVIKNLNTNDYYAYHEREEFLSASLYKLWTMGAVYEKIEAGKLKKNQVISAQVEELNEQFRIASEEAELTEGSVSYPVEDALEQMITISHNYAALLLTSTIRLQSTKEFLAEYGFTNSYVGADLPKTTAHDIAKYYELLYKKQIVNSIYSEEMMARLQRQRLNDRIPKYLPEDVKVAHKTGELYGFKHDAGIVFAPFGDYIIVLLTESKNPADTAERMAKLSQAVYEYFEKKSG